MRIAPGGFEKHGRWSLRHGAIAVSILLHLVVGITLFWITAPVPRYPAVREALPIEILSEADFARLLPKPVQPPPVLRQTPQAPDTAPTETPAAGPDIHAPITAGRMMSEALQNGPLGARMRAELASMGDETRLQQLCNIEAMAQIEHAHPAFHAHKVVAYASGAVETGPDLLIARHAAVEANGGWHHLTYRCALAPGHHTLKGMELAIGKPIPPAYWERYNLPAPGRRALD
jgi:hypothetical protein